jgi:uncharacterized DUF497 family protein
MDIPRLYRWNPVKAQTNVNKHRVAFEFVQRVFDDPMVEIVPTIRSADGEERYKAIGMIDGKLYVAVFTIVEDACRLISGRRTNVTEDRLYDRRIL